MNPPTQEEFQEALNEVLRGAHLQGIQFVDVNSSTLHRKVGGYPGKNHRMPSCCDVMLANMKLGDQIIKEPQKGKGASLIIRYLLPR